MQNLIKERILVLDGAMGTMIQQYNLTEADFRGERFQDIPGQLKGLLHQKISFAKTKLFHFLQ